MKTHLDVRSKRIIVESGNERFLLLIRPLTPNKLAAVERILQKLRPDSIVVYRHSFMARKITFDGSVDLFGALRAIYHLPVSRSDVEFAEGAALQDTIAHFTAKKLLW